MKEKETYTLSELYNSLPITMVELSKISGIHEVTLARIRDGEKTRRDTANKLLLAMSKVYSLDINIGNVSGINILRNFRKEAKEARLRLAEKDKSEDSRV